MYEVNFFPSPGHVLSVISTSTYVCTHSGSTRAALMNDLNLVTSSMNELAISYIGLFGLEWFFVTFLNIPTKISINFILINVYKSQAFDESVSETKRVG